MRELPVDLLDLVEHVLRLRPLRVDVRVGGGGLDGGQGNGHENRRQEREDHAGAFRLLELTTSSPSARAHRAPRWGPGPSQVGHPSSLPGRPQRSIEPKTGRKQVALRITNNGSSAPKTCYGPRLVGTHSTSDAARLAAVFTGLLLVASVPVALAADASGLRSQAASLRASDESLEARANAATLELYALEAELGRARTRGREHRRTAGGRSNAIAPLHASSSRSRATRCSVSESRLAELVRALYEQSGHADPLAILLGAASLEEALTGLDSLSRAAGENSRIIEQARASRQRLAALDARLAAREAELARLGAAATARARDARRRGRDARALRRRPAPPAGPQCRPDRLDRGAGAERGGRGRRRSRPRPRPSRRPSSRSRRPPWLRRRSRRAAGRSPSAPPATPCADAPRPASRPRPGVVAVDPSVIPLGTRMTIPGYGEGDRRRHRRRRARKHDRPLVPVDRAGAAWGRRTVTITLR